MDVRFFILLAVFALCNVLLIKWSNSSISGEITENITFLHKTFPVPPSMRAIIEVDVYYPDNSTRHHPILGIYTTEDHVNINKRCVYTTYGQLGNKDLHQGLTTDRSLSGPLKCDTTRTDTLHCVGKLTVQDFIPRQFSFSFGFLCDEISQSSSLKGLVYNTNLYITNETNCYDLLQEDE